MLFKSAFVLALMAVAALAQNNNTNSIFQVLQSQSGQTDQLVSLLSSPQYSEIVSRLSGNGSNGTYTFFAPSDSALTKALQNLSTSVDLTSVLLYHLVNSTYTSNNFTTNDTILPTFLTNNTLDFFPDDIGLPLAVKNNGSALQVFFGLGEANVTQADLRASNGVVHIVDTVLIPPTSPSLTAQNGGLNSFYSALNSTNSTSSINGKHGITIFAPSDDAFNSLNQKNLNASQIQNILAYHIVDGIYFLSNFSNFSSPTNLTTEQGSNITVSRDGNSIQITDISGNHTAKVIRSDIITDNGVLHVIDTVLIPSLNSTIPNNTQNNLTKPDSAANKIIGADVSLAAIFIAVIVTAVSLLL